MLQVIKHLGWLLWRISRRTPFSLGLVVIVGIAGGSSRGVDLCVSLLVGFAVETIARATMFALAPPLERALAWLGALFSRYSAQQPGVIAGLALVLAIWTGIATEQPLAVIVFGAAYAAAYPLLIARARGLDALSLFRRAETTSSISSPNIPAAEEALLRILVPFYAPDRDFKTEEGTVDKQAQAEEVMSHITKIEEEEGEVVKFDIRNNTPGKTDEDLVKVLDSMPNVVGAYDFDDITPGRSPKGYKSFAVYFQEKYDATRQSWGYPSNLEVAPTHVPVGVLQDGTIASTTLLEHLFFAGASGSGKSKSALAQRISAAQLPGVAFIGIDPKRMELSLWGKRFSHISRGHCCIPEILTAVLDELERRTKIFEEQKLDELTPDMWSKMPLIVLDIDEAAQVFNSVLGRDVSELNTVLMNRLIALGRAPGIQITAATQRLAGDIIPKEFMTNMPQKVVCRTADSNETLMAMRNATLVKNNPAHDIPVGKSHKGEAYIIAEGEELARGAKMKSFLALNEKQRAAIVTNPEAIEAEREMAQNRTIQDWVALTAHNRVTLPWLDDHMNQHYRSAHPELYDPTVPSFYELTQQDADQDFLNLQKH